MIDFISSFILCIIFSVLLVAFVVLAIPAILCLIPVALVGLPISFLVHYSLEVEKRNRHKSL
jgi:Flp pilus assembly protein TadB